jgi:hypothetical protein
MRELAGTAMAGALLVVTSGRWDWGKCGTLPIFLSDVKARYDKIVELVERMLDPSTSSGQALHKQLPKAKPPHGNVNIVDYHGPYTGS